MSDATQRCAKCGILKEEHSQYRLQQTHAFTPAPPAKGVPFGRPGHCFDADGEWWHETGKCVGAPMNCDGKCCGFDTPEPKTAEAAMSEEEFDALNYGLAPQRRLHAEARRARAEEKRLREQIETILNDPGYNAIRQSDQALRGALEEIVDTVRSKVDVYARIVQIRNLAAAALRGVKK